MILTPLLVPSLRQPTIELKVDLDGEHHPISALIFGMNDNTGDVDHAFAREIRLPVSRWGGDATSRYNWKNDGTNSGDDWFFMAGNGQTNPIPGASADAFIARAKAAGGIALLTMPIIDFINRTTSTDCSYPVSIFGPQQKTNPYVHPMVDGKQTDAGNGRKPDGTPIVLTQDQILRVNEPNSRSFQETWLKHLISKFGKASGGGVAIYQMDNEPTGWSNTHRDIHPLTPTYREILDKTIWYSNQVKQSDPTAKVLGPGDFGWPAYKGDLGKQNGFWNAELYLQQMQVASTQSGVRLLDYFDEHYYPTQDDGGEPIALAPAGTAATQAARLQSTRSLWDPAYVENDWIGKYNGAIRLIPRMREWAAKFYPGTKTAITEYNFGGLDSINGAICEADVLGIFAREQLDLATMWGPPKPNQPAAFAFRMYRNYDGKGSGFGDVYLHSASSDQSQVSIYAARRSLDQALTVMLINKTPQSADAALSLVAQTGPSQRTGQAFRYSADHLETIEPISLISIRSGKTNLTLPPNSITLLILSP